MLGLASVLASEEPFFNKLRRGETMRAPVFSIR